MGALARRSGRHRAGLAGAALLALLLAAPAQAAREKVRWETSGGIAGISRSLMVDTDRTARAEENGAEHAFRLGDRRWRQLQRRLRAARFAGLEREYAPPARIPDGTLDEVRHRGRTVSVETGGDPPRRLVRLIALLARIHSAHAPSR